MQCAWWPVLWFPWRMLRLRGDGKTVRGASSRPKRIGAAARRIISSHAIDQERILVDVRFERALGSSPDALSVLGKRDGWTAHPISRELNLLRRRRPESEDDHAIGAHLRGDQHRRSLSRSGCR